MAVTVSRIPFAEGISTASPFGVSVLSFAGTWTLLLRDFFLARLVRGMIAG